MRRLAIVVFGVVAFVLAACAPTTVVPGGDLVAQMPYEEAFRATISAINSQPYPSNTSGWVILDSDQVGGFVTAQLNGQTCALWVYCDDYTARVSVSLADRGDGSTAVNISGTRGNDEAEKLAKAIAERLGV